jgi:hypothetical protein
MKILESYGWTSAQDFGYSLAPSFKYHLGMVSIVLSGVLGTLQSILGLSMITAVAFMALALVELLTGIYASVIVRRQKLQSGKMSRFLIKLAIMLICLFILGAFAKEYKETRLLGQLFQWMRDGVFSFTAIEYFVSILENLTTISGKKNNRLLGAVKSKLDKILEDPLKHDQ